MDWGISIGMGFGATPGGVSTLFCFETLKFDEGTRFKKAESLFCAVDADRGATSIKKTANATVGKMRTNARVRLQSTVTNIRTVNITFAKPSKVIQ